MNNEEKWTAALQKLTKLTAQGAIEWDTIPFDRVPDAKPDRLIGKYYTATHQNRRFLVYEFTYPYYVSETDSYVQTNDIRIQLIDDDFNLEFRIPEVEARWNLLEAIRSQTAGADEFLDNFLKP